MKRTPRDCAPIPNGDGTSRIPLTCGQFATIDTVDEPRVRGMLWYAREHADRSGFYARGKFPSEPKQRYLHRILLCFPMDHVDHIDGDGLNNRRSNLRIATVSENQWNRTRVNGESRFKGVSRSASSLNPWRASICQDQQRIEIGIFATEAAAAAAYNRYAKKMFGAFAALNDIDDQVEETRAVRKYKNGFKGVFREHGKYVAILHREQSKKRTLVRIGVFATAIEAAIAHDQKAIELLGDKAITNASLGLISSQPLCEATP